MRLRSAVLPAALLLSPAAALADGGIVLSHVGMLVDGADVPVDNLAQPLAFRFFATSVHADAETPAWESGTCSVRVQKGRYVVLLGGAGSDDGCGPVIPLGALPPGAPRYLEVSVGGVALSPRLRLGSVPNAGFAERALLADKATVSLDTQALAAGLKDAGGTLNAASNPVHWSQLTGVPAAFADGTDDSTTYQADGQSLQLSGTTFAVKANGVGVAQLASDPAAFAKLSNGQLAVDAQGNLQLQGNLTLAPGAHVAGDGAGLTNLQASALVGTISAANLPSDLASGAFRGNVSIGGTLQVTGATTHTGAVTVPADGFSVGSSQLVASGGSIGIGTAQPAARLEVAGEVKVGNTQAACSAALQGAIRFNAAAKMLEFCNGTAWWPVNVDDQPDALSFTASIGTAGALVTSNTITVNGFSVALPVSVSGSGAPQIRVNNSAWGTSGTVSQGDQLTVRLTVPTGSPAGTNLTATVTVGSATTTWTVSSGYNTSQLRTVSAGGATYTVALAANSSDSCSTTCSARGLTCSDSQLASLQTWAKTGTNYRSMLTDLFGLTFSTGSYTPNPMNNGTTFFGIGCPSGTWSFNGFGAQVSGCSSSNVNYDTSTMTCGSQGYVNGNYSGPRICTCQ